MKKKHGFTLAEVLITLMIIGIVAALTIPSVISNYQQQQFKTGLKKAVSVLNEAIHTNITLEGVTPNEAEDLFDYIKKHMSVVNSYIYPSSRYGNRYFYTTDGMRFEVPHANMSPDTSVEITSLKLHESGISANGRRMIKDCDEPQCILYANDGHCGSYGLANNPNNTISTPCVVMVDVNGEKKPSPKEVDTDKYEDIWAKPNDKKLTDVFTILITDEKAVPFGVVAQRAMYSSK